MTPAFFGLWVGGGIGPQSGTKDSCGFHIVAIENIRWAHRANEHICQASDDGCVSAPKFLGKERTLLKRGGALWRKNDGLAGISAKRSWHARGQRFETVILQLSRTVSFLEGLKGCSGQRKSQRYAFRSASFPPVGTTPPCPTISRSKSQSKMHSILARRYRRSLGANL
jgi:hypothetical protein